MSVANVVMMDFESEEALLEFQTNYDKNAPTLYSEAEILLFIRTGDDKSA